MKVQDKPGNNLTSAQANDSVAVEAADEVSLERRQALAALARRAAYVAPATLALLTMEAKACSLTC